MKQLKALWILVEFKNRENILGRTPYKESEYEEAIAKVKALQEENEHLKLMVEAFKKENK